MILLFKYPDEQRQFAKLDPGLVHIVLWAIHEAWVTSKDTLVVTSMYRNQEGSVHKYYRGIDIAMLEHGDSEKLRESINKKFPYGKPGIDTVPPLSHGSADHFHFQIRSK